MVITQEDLFWLKHKVRTIKSTTSNLIEEDYKKEISKTFDKKKDEKFFYEPVEWKTFIETLKEITDACGKSSVSDLEEILNLLSEKIKNKKFSFKRYQNEYSNTKTNLILNAFKIGLIFDSRSPDIAVIKDAPSIVNKL
jgi:hypothetical protein